MIRYVLNRLLWMIPIILGVSLLVFFLISLCPGDPATIILGNMADAESVRALNEQLGFYDPFWVRYFRYMAGVFKLDFGQSYCSRLPVLGELKVKIPISITVAFLGIVGALAVGIPLGVLSAVKQYSLLDIIPTSIAMALAAAPSFWVGMMLMFWLALKHNLLPSFGTDKPMWYILPTLTLMAVHGSTMLRFTRSSMLETIRQDYIRTARAKGATESVVVWRHELKNALLPVITAAGNTFGVLLGGAIVCETLYSIGGLGTYVVNGIKMNDLPVVMGGTITLATMFAMVNLIVDLLYAFFDPRVKARYQRRRG